MSSLKEHAPKAEQQPPALAAPIKTDAEVRGMHLRRAQKTGIVFGDYPNGDYISTRVVEWNRRQPNFRLSILTAHNGTTQFATYTCEVGTSYNMHNTPVTFHAEVIRYKGLALLDFTVQAPRTIPIHRAELFAKTRNRKN